jgi:type IV pilus biogenesis protein PilP
MQTDFPPMYMRVTLALLALSGPLAQAAAVTAAADNAASSTADTLGRIESQTLLLKAQERQLAVRLQIAQQQNDIGARQADLSRLAQPARASDPGVLAVERVGASTVATLLFDNGSTAEVSSGDALPNGMTVLSVRHNEVLVHNSKKQRVRLAAVSLPAPAGLAVAGAPPAGARMPLMLPPLNAAQIAAQGAMQTAPVRGAGQ